MFRPMAGRSCCWRSPARCCSRSRSCPPWWRCSCAAGVAEAESPVVRRVRELYLPSLRWALGHRRLVLAGPGALLVACGVARDPARQRVRADARRAGHARPAASACPGSASSRRWRCSTRVEAVARGDSRRCATCSRDSAPPRSRTTRCRSASPTRYVILKPRRQWPDPRQAQGRRSSRRWSAKLAAAARQRLRVHAADRDALQRADRRRAQRRRRQGVRRRSRRDARDREPRSRASLRSRSGRDRRARSSR